jgi:hypothetical protein
VLHDENFVIYTVNRLFVVKFGESTGFSWVIMRLAYELPVFHNCGGEIVKMCAPERKKCGKKGENVMKSVSRCQMYSPKGLLFCAVTQHSLMYRYLHFAATCDLHLQGTRNLEASRFFNRGSPDCQSTWSRTQRTVFVTFTGISLKPISMEIVSNCTHMLYHWC